MTDNTNFVEVDDVVVFFVVVGYVTGVVVVVGGVCAVVVVAVDAVDAVDGVVPDRAALRAFIRGYLPCPQKAPLKSSRSRSHTIQPA